MSLIVYSLNKNEMVLLFSHGSFCAQCQYGDAFQASNGQAVRQSGSCPQYRFYLFEDERPEKWERCVQQLAPYGIYPYRFSAVNGWKLSSELFK